MLLSPGVKADIIWHVGSGGQRSRLVSYQGSSRSGWWSPICCSIPQGRANFDTKVIITWQDVVVGAEECDHGVFQDMKLRLMHETVAEFLHLKYSSNKVLTCGAMRANYT